MLRDSLHAVDIEEDVMCITVEMESSALVLTQNGRVCCYDIDTFEKLPQEWNLDTLIDGEEGRVIQKEDKEWFLMTLITESGNIVCVSHSGQIACIQVEPVTCARGDVAVLEGEVDGGIAGAAWSPDQSRLVICTNNETILCMTSAWEVLEEIPMPEGLAPGNPCAMSWKGDGSQFALLNTDKGAEGDRPVNVRVFSNELELVSKGRNVAEGKGSQLKGVGSTVSFAPNGTLIAIAQERVKGKHQVAFLEKNGLRHGDFDVRAPVLSDAHRAQGHQTWEIRGLHWDITSTILAVELVAVGGGGISPCVVQFYSRGNYHWYLKQQWSHVGLHALGFDAETSGRMYMQMRSADSGGLILRIIDVVWDVNATDSGDATAAVTDGAQLQLTPLGKAIVPPPMSKHKAALSGVCRHTFNWSGPASSGADMSYANGFGALCDGVDGAPLLDLFFLDADGNPAKGCFPVRGVSMQTQCDDVATFTRSVLVTCVGEDLRVLKLESVIDVNGGSKDRLRLMSLQKGSSQLVEIARPLRMDAMVLRLSTWASDTAAVAVSLALPEGGYEVQKLDIGGADMEFVELPYETRERLQLPEQCARTIVVNASENDQSEPVPLAIGLTTRSNRLYYGEMLVVAGASSFAVNEGLRVLMYVTVGSSPHLHFVPLSALVLGLDVEEQHTLDAYEPRPVERGARLVAAVSGQPTVIVQQPRGNLEAFEPRPLLLARARQLLRCHPPMYLDCLALLRRQKIDLNFLVDFCPKDFIAGASELVRQCIVESETDQSITKKSYRKDSAIDMLALLISNLQPENIVATKYPCPQYEAPISDSNSVGIDRTDPTSAPSPGNRRYTDIPDPAPWTMSNKVSVICETLRAPLLQLLEEGSIGALHPVLCTYAKHDPPMLEEGLLCIRSHLSMGSLEKDYLASSKAQSAIRYYSFLANTRTLFDAAVGMCDFHMARAIARQGQMDPKEYLPLLERLEFVGKGSTEGSYPFLCMHLSANLHLGRAEKTIEWGVRALQVLLESLPADGDAVDYPISCEILCSHILSAVSSTKIADIGDIDTKTHYAFALPKLSDLVDSATATGEVQTAARTLLSDARLAYGLWLAKSITTQNTAYVAEAVATFLSVFPPAVTEAIQVALKAEDWQQALALSGRYQHRLAPEFHPKTIAADIVTVYRANLENARGYDDDELGFSDAIATAATPLPSTDYAQAQVVEDKVSQAAKLCIDFFSPPDVDGAVSILIFSGRYRDATHTALRYGRQDLLLDDIGTTVRSTARESIKYLKTRTQRVSTLVQELATTFWLDPEARLAEVRASEPQLQREMDWLEAGGYDGNTANDGDDAASLYSANTARSDLSFVSGISGASNISSRSSNSQISANGASTVSVLSDLMVASERDQATLAKDRTGKQFGITGIDHALLSRGCGQEGAWDMSTAVGQGGRKPSKRQLKKNKQKDGRLTERRGKDTVRLSKESAICMELWSLAQVAAIAYVCSEQCEVLLMLGEPDDFKLACQLQAAMDDYAEAVRSNPVKIAPAYPLSFLESREMHHLLHFQDFTSEGVKEKGVGNNAYARYQETNWTGTNGKVKADKEAPESWWHCAARGISVWHDDLRRVVLMKK